MESSIHLKRDKVFFANAHDLKTSNSLVFKLGQDGQTVVLYVYPEQGFDIGTALIQAGTDLIILSSSAKTKELLCPGNDG